MLLKKSKLIDCKSKGPGDVSWSNEGGVVMLGDEKHVIVVI